MRRSNSGKCVHCGSEITEEGAVYCASCGYGLGVLSIDVIRPCEVPTTGDSEGHFELRCENQGTGDLILHFSHNLDGLILNGRAAPREGRPDEPERLAPGEPREFRGRFPSAQVGTARQLTLIAHSSGHAPAKRDEVRRQSLRPALCTEAIGIEVVAVDPVRPRAMPYVVVFPKRGRRAFIPIANDGAEPLTYEIGPLPAGFHFGRTNPSITESPEELVLSRDGRTRTVELQPHEAAEVYIEAPPLHEAWDTASVEVRVFDQEPHTVHLHREPIEDILAAPVSKILGLDFGTDKTAAFQSDYDPSGEGRSKPEELFSGPSTLLFKAASPHEPVVGERPDLKEPDDVLVQGLKLQVQEAPDKPVEVGDERYLPERLIRMFLRDRLAEAHAAACFDGLDPKEDIQHVLTIPVMERREDRVERAELMRRVALALELPEDLVSADHTEPDCAAIDFLHQHLLGNSDYDFQLKPGDTICVVDVGAGTTDVSILRWHPGKAGERVRFEVLGAVGFFFGGVEIDQLIYWELCKRAKVTPELADRVFPAVHVHEWQGIRPTPGHREYLAFTSVRGEKERMYEAFWAGDESVPVIAASPEDWEQAFPGSGDPPQLAYGDMDDLLRPRLHELLNGSGQEGSDTRRHCLKASLAQAQIKATDIDWVFLTGGSSAVVQIGRALDDFFSEAGNTQLRIIKAPLKDAPLSVARGAAVRYAYTIEGSLPCDLSVRIQVPGAEKEREYRMLTVHEMPGARRVRRIALRAGVNVRVSVMADFGHLQGCVYQTNVDLGTDDRSTFPWDLSLELQFVRGQALQNEVYLTTRAAVRGVPEAEAGKPTHEDRVKVLTL